MSPASVMRRSMTAEGEKEYDCAEGEKVGVVRACGEKRGV